MPPLVPDLISDGPMMHLSHFGGSRGSEMVSELSEVSCSGRAKVNESTTCLETLLSESSCLLGSLKPASDDCVAVEEAATMRQTH